jgi:hypothetical protein
MDVIVTTSVFENYFDSILTFPKSEYQQDLTSLINNTNNRFVVSKDIVEALEDKYRKSSISSFVLPFIANLINEQSLVVTSTGKKEEREIALTIVDAYSRILNPNKGEAFLVLCPEEIGALPYVNTSQITEKNKDWLWFKIACVHPLPIVLTHSDFKSNDEIKSLIKSFFYKQKEDEFYVILDRQANFTHTLFDFFRSNSRVVYYTSFETHQEHKQKFPKYFSNCRIYCDRRNQIHERKVLKNNVVMHVDNDFWSMSIADTTWTMSLYFDPKLALRISDKVKRFKDPNKRQRY